MPDLVDGLTLAMLIAGTLEYAILMRHRESRRYDLRMDESIAEAGLRALVRVVLIEGQQGPRWRRARRSFLPIGRASRQPLTQRMAASRRFLTRIGMTQPPY